MDIEQLLQEKKLRLEQLRKQRLSTQRELQTDPNNDAQTPDPTSHHVTETPTTISESPSVSAIDSHEDILHAETHGQPHIEIKPLNLKINNTEENDHSDTINDINIQELTLNLKRELTKSIRLELEEKYKSLFKTLNTDTKQTDPSPNDPKEATTHHHTNLQYPTSKVMSISICECEPNRFLSIHDDCICIWEIRNKTPQLLKNITTYSTVNCAIFNIQDPDIIIIGYETGFLNILNIHTDAVIRSRIQLNPIITIHSNLNNSYNIICSNGDFLKISNNLIDLLIPTINIFNSMEFNFSSLNIPMNNLYLLSSFFISSNNLIINLINNNLLLIDLLNYKLTKLNTHDHFNSPIISISYNSNKLSILDLNHNLNVLNLLTNSSMLKDEDSIYLPNLSFFIKWISPTSILCVSMDNLITVWDFKNNNDLVKLKEFKWNNGAEKDNRTISSVMVLDLDTILIGDLNGGIHACHLNNVNIS